MIKKKNLQYSTVILINWWESCFTAHEPYQQHSHGREELREQRGGPGAPMGPLMDLANPLLKMLRPAATAESRTRLEDQQAGLVKSRCCYRWIWVFADEVFFFFFFFGKQKTKQIIEQKTGSKSGEMNSPHLTAISFYLTFKFRRIGVEGVNPIQVYLKQLHVCQKSMVPINRHDTGTDAQ